MKVFVSYAFTGEEEAALAERLHAIKGVLESLAVDYYINIYDPDYREMVENNVTPDVYLEAAFKSLKSSDVVLVINTSERRSEGMLMEVGAAKILNKKIIIAQHKTSVGKTYLPDVADETFVWSSEVELLNSVRESIQKLNYV